jgi:hypothetical protein
MPAIANHRLVPETTGIDPERLGPSPFSVSLYGDPSGEVDDLIASVREHGILVPLVVAAPGPEPETWEILSGHCRLACARALGMIEVLCQMRRLPRGDARRLTGPIPIVPVVDLHDGVQSSIQLPLSPRTPSRPFSPPPLTECLKFAKNEMHLGRAFPDSSTQCLGRTVFRQF